MGVHMIRRWNVRIGLVLLAGLSACSLPQVQQPLRDGRDATVGCYFVTHGPWSSNAFFGTDTLADRFPPAHMRLFVSGDAEPGIRLLGAGFPPIAGRWYILRADTLVVRWVDDAGGMELRVGADSLALVGKAKAWSGRDGSEGPSTDIRAVKRAC